MDTGIWKGRKVDSDWGENFNKMVDFCQDGLGLVLLLRSRFVGAGIWGIKGLTGFDLEKSG